MKFIGQYIQQFIARFRNDVYLEDVSTGTIASGANLGLDSNNKIVKAANVGSSVDLTSEVSGVLPVTNGGTGASSLASTSLLTGNGNSPIQAQSSLLYSSELLSIGNSDNGRAEILRSNGDQSNGGGPLRVAGGRAVNGGTNNLTGGDLELVGGAGVGDGASGGIKFYNWSTVGSGNSPQTSINEIASITGAGNLQIDGGLTTGSTSAINSSGVIQVATQGTIDHDSLANFEAEEHYRWDTDISSTATINAANIPTLNQNTTGSSASCTGQAATVATIAGLAPNTATTAAAQPNITSVGTLTGLSVNGTTTTTGITSTPSSGAAISLNSSAADGSPYIEFTQNGTRRTFIQHNDTDNTLKLSSEYGAISLLTGTTGTNEAERLGISSAGVVSTSGDLTVGGSLTVGDTNISGPIITMTGSTDDTFAIRTTTDGETIFTTIDTAGAAAHMNFNPDGEFRVTSDDIIFKSNTSAHPTVKIQNQTADATSGELVFYNERHGGNGVGNDELGSIHFKGPNGDGSDAEFNFASIIGKNLFPNDTDETGLLEIKVATSDGSTSALQSGITMIGHPTANAILMTLGYSTTCTTIVSGRLQAARRQFSKTANTDGTHDGDIVYFGSTTSMTTGAIYFYNSSGNWELTDADGVGKSSGLLGVALGSASDTDGVLLRGMVTLSHDPGAVGDVLYLSTTGGQCSSTAPSGGGDIIRIVGYCLDASNGQIWFNPDNTFVEYTT